MLRSSHRGILMTTYGRRSPSSARGFPVCVRPINGAFRRARFHHSACALTRGGPAGGEHSPRRHARAHPVTVTDGLDRPYMGLGRDNFRVFEDGVEQRIRCFPSKRRRFRRGCSSMPAAACAAAWIIARSGGGVLQIVAAGRRILSDPLQRRAARGAAVYAQPGGDFARAEFHRSPWLDGALRRHLPGGAPDEGGQERAARAAGAEDGADNHSRYSESEIRDLVLESDVRVYAVGLFERPRFLEKLAAETGGSVVWTRKLKELPDAVARLNTELRSQYVLGYAPTNAQRDGRYRKVRVELVAAAPQVRAAAWRRGYYAPE